MGRLMPFLCASVTTCGLVLVEAIHPALRLVYNASESAPRGFYVVTPVARLSIGDYVVARLPRDVERFAAERGYLPRGVPVLKQVLAVPGQSVCGRDGWFYVDGAAVARPLVEDAQHRSLNTWEGCRLLLPGEFFLLNPAASGSFDSRYFGPLDISYVRGRATRL